MSHSLPEKEAQLLKDIMLTRCYTPEDDMTVDQLISGNYKNILEIYGIQLLTNETRVVLFPDIVRERLLKRTDWKESNIRSILRNCPGASKIRRRIRGYNIRGIAIPLEIMQKAKEGKPLRKKKTATITRKQFENRPIKREINDYIISKIKAYGDKGSIVTLAGPALKQHYKELTELLRKKSQIMFAENDKALTQNENLLAQVESLNDPRIVLYQGDVWKGINALCISERDWIHKHVLFNFDFCCTALTAVKLNLYENLSELASSKLPRKTGFWLVLTFCRRGNSEETWQEAISKILHIFREHHWFLSEHATITYSERKKDNKKHRASANMVTLHFRFHWNYSNKPIKKHNPCQVGYVTDKQILKSIAKLVGKT